VRAFLVGITAVTITLASVRADDGPFDVGVLAQAFELSKTCSKECSNGSVVMVRLPSQQGKAAFLLTTTDQSFCGSAGCSSIVVLASGDKFVPVKEGQGITESAALAAIQGETDAALDEKPSFDCSKATSASARLICSDAELSKADGALGAKFKMVIADLDQVSRKQRVEQQLTWLRARNTRCGVGPDKSSMPTDLLNGAKACMLEAIRARVAELGADRLGVQEGNVANQSRTAGVVGESTRSVSSSAQSNNLSGSGLLGDWAQICDDVTPHNYYFIGKDGAPYRAVYIKKTFFLHKIITLESRGADLKLTAKGIVMGEPEATVYQIFRISNGLLYSIDSRTQSGKVLAENGQFTFGPLQGQPIPPSLKCGSNPSGIAVTKIQELSAATPQPATNKPNGTFNISFVADVAPAIVGFGGRASYVQGLNFEVRSPEGIKGRIDCQATAFINPHTIPNLPFQENTHVMRIGLDRNTNIYQWLVSDVERVEQLLRSIQLGAKNECQKYLQKGLLQTIEFDMLKGPLQAIPTTTVAYIIDSRLAFGAYNSEGSPKWIITKNQPKDDDSARQVQVQQQQREQQAAAQKKLEIGTRIQKGLDDARQQYAGLVETADFKEFITPVLNFYRARREQWGPFTQVCSAGYEYISGAVIGRSIEGLTGVILMDILAVNKNDSEIVTGSPFASICGNPDQPLTPGGILRMRIRANFRKYDTGWQFEGLAP
jgi:uncharacterized protein YecT (DUF1311 family)